MVGKVKKKRGQVFELIKVMQNSDFIVVYDTTNYNNYHEGGAHSATIILPKELSKISSKQLKSFLHLSRDILSEYNMSDDVRELTEVAYSDKKNKSVNLGTLSDVINELTDSIEIDNNFNKNNQKR